MQHFADLPSSDDSHPLSQSSQSSQSSQPSQPSQFSGVVSSLSIDDRYTSLHPQPSQIQKVRNLPSLFSDLATLPWSLRFDDSDSHSRQPQQPPASASTPTNSSQSHQGLPPSPPSVLEDREALKNALQGIAKLPSVMLSLSSAMLNVNAFSTDPITKVPLVIATTTAFFAVILHSLASLQFHILQSAHHVDRLLSILVTFLAVSVFATLFAIPAHSWSQTECSSYCWVERVIVSIVVIGGVASLITGGWYVRGGGRRSVV